MAASSRHAVQGRRTVTDHGSFLRHRHFRWLKLGSILALFALVGFLFAQVPPVPYGGTWYGYTLGTIGAVLILWLSLLGSASAT